MKRRIKLVFTVSTILIFILPMILISVLYILIGLQLRKSKIYKRGTTKGSVIQLIVGFLKYKLFENYKNIFFCIAKMV